MSGRRMTRVTLAFWGCAVYLMLSSWAASEHALDAPDVWAQYARLPLHFEMIHGILETDTLYVARGAQGDVYLAPAELNLLINADVGDGTIEQRRLCVQLVGARSDARAEVLEPLRGRVNYLVGPDAGQWRTNIPTFGKIRFTGVYPGIDLVYYGNHGSIEYDFVVHPGADFRDVVLSIEGADFVELDPDGNLVILCHGNSARFLAPAVYQLHAGNRIHVPGRYVLDGDRRVRFDIGAYDPAVPLIIDPVVQFASYVGLSSVDARGVGVDGQGNMYVAGITYSSESPLPGTHVNTPLGGGQNIFVVKFSPDGKEVIYSTFIGGSDKGTGKAMYVDAEGCAYIGGNTKSTDLPTSGFISHYAPTYDFLVVKVNPAGDGLAYCCVFGGESMEEIRGITVDSKGNCIAVGGSHSPDLPTTPGSFQPVYKDPPEETPDVAGSFTKGEDAVIAKINPSGTAFVFCTWLGGHGFEKAWAVAVDKADDIYVAGHVEATDFPVSDGAFQTTHGGGVPRDQDQYGPKDAFVAKLSADGSRLLAATYFGGSGQDVGYGIGVDNAGNVYLAGNTDSPNLPVMNAAFGDFCGGKSDVFVACLDPTLSRLRYATYWGGAEKDEITSDGFAVDRRGYAYAVGGTNAQIPTTPRAFIKEYVGGESDGFLVRFTPAGQVDYATLIGGSGTDQCGDIALDRNGGVFVTGSTRSNDFVLKNPFRISLGGDRDAFLAKFQFAETVAMNDRGVGCSHTYP